MRASNAILMRLLVALLCWSTASASTVLTPSDARGHLATTTLKFFGPQHFSLNTTGCPLVELSTTALDKIFRDSVVSSLDVADAVVIFDVDLWTGDPVLAGGGAASSGELHGSLPLH